MLRTTASTHVEMLMGSLKFAFANMFLSYFIIRTWRFKQLAQSI